MRKIAVTITIALVATSALAQTDVVVKQVNDRRTSGSFSQLVISVELPKVRSGDVAASRVLVSSAVDDSGRNLVDPEASEPDLEPNHRGLMDKDSAAEPVTISVTLKNPDRKAKKVKEVRGEIELYMPGKDPNSVADVPKFLSTSGKPIAHRALKANGVEIALVNATQLAAERKRLGDLKRKEAAAAGYTGEDLESTVKYYVESLLTVDEGDLLVRINDPNKRIQSINYVDAAGEVKRVSTRDDQGFTYLSTWGEKPQPDWKLQVSMKTPKNTQRQAFVMKDVALP
jgi:hypothetical protein